MSEGETSEGSSNDNRKVLCVDTKCKPSLTNATSPYLLPNKIISIQETFLQLLSSERCSIKGTPPRLLNYKKVLMIPKGNIIQQSKLNKV